MTSAIRNLGGVAVHLAPVVGPPITGERDALDLIGETCGRGAEWIAIPIERLSPGFFQLRTGLAGAILQKLANYRFKVAILGDVTAQVLASKAFADFVTESNRSRQVWFVPDVEALEARLAERG